MRCVPSIRCKKSGELGSRAYAEIESRVARRLCTQCSRWCFAGHVVVAIAQGPAPPPAAVDAYAQQAARFGQTMAAMDEIETALRREWSPSLVATYGSMGAEDLEQRLRRAESWIDTHPNDAVLLTAVGRMCVRARLWGKAKPYLERALAIEPNVAAWEALGDVYVGEDHPELAQRCYRNALALARGEATEALPDELRQPSHRHPCHGSGRARPAWRCRACRPDHWLAAPTRYISLSAFLTAFARLDVVNSCAPFRPYT